MNNGWIRQIDYNTNEYYYFNVNTRQSTFEIPERVLSQSWEVVEDMETNQILFLYRPSGTLYESAPTEAFIESTRSNLEWEMVYDDETDRYYWLNSSSDDATWIDTRLKPSTFDGVMLERLDLEWYAILKPETDQLYFYNSKTGDSQWERPPGLHVLHLCKTTTADTWEIYHDDITGRVYYYNRADGTSQWELPPELQYRIAVDTNKNNWEELAQPEEAGMKYYYNRVDGRSAWHMTETMHLPPGADDSDPESDTESEMWRYASPWIKVRDPNTSLVFYYNRDTRESQWIHPGYASCIDKEGDWFSVWDDETNTYYYYNKKTGGFTKSWPPQAPPPAMYDEDTTITTHTPSTLDPMYTRNTPPNASEQPFVSFNVDKFASDLKNQFHDMVSSISPERNHISMTYHDQSQGPIDTSDSFFEKYANIGRTSLSTNTSPLLMRKRKNDFPDSLNSHNSMFASRSGTRQNKTIWGILDMRTKDPIPRWKPFWFLLGDKHLEYHDTDYVFAETLDQEPVGVINLTRITGVVRIDQEPTVFTLNSGEYAEETCYVLRCVSRDARSRWTRLIESELELQNDESPKNKKKFEIEEQDYGRFGRPIGRANCDSPNPGFLYFEKGDIIQLLDISRSEQWIGECYGSVGLVNPSFIDVIDHGSSYSSKPLFSLTDASSYTTFGDRNMSTFRVSHSPPEKLSVKLIHQLENRIADITLQNHQYLVEIRGYQWLNEKKISGSATIPESSMSQLELQKYRRLLTVLRDKPTFLVQMVRNMTIEAQSTLMDTILKTLYGPYSVCLIDIMDFFQEVLHEWRTDTLPSVARAMEEHDMVDVVGFGGALFEVMKTQSLLSMVILSLVERHEFQDYCCDVWTPIKVVFCEGFVCNHCSIPELGEMLLNALTNENVLGKIPPVVSLMFRSFSHDAVHLHHALMNVLLIPSILLFFDYIPFTDALKTKLARFIEWLDTPSNFTLERGNSVVVTKYDAFVSRLLEPPTLNVRSFPRPGSGDCVVISCFDLFLLHLSLERYIARQGRDKLPKQLVPVVEKLGEPVPLEPGANPYVLFHTGARPKISDFDAYTLEATRLELKARSQDSLPRPSQSKITTVRHEEQETRSTISVRELNSRQGILEETLEWCKRCNVLLTKQRRRVIAITSPSKLGRKRIVQI